MKKAFIILLTLLFSFTSTAVFAAQDDDVAVTMDLLLLRPIGFATLVGGTGIFILSLPLAVISGSVGKTSNALVVEPLKYTFTRPLGDYDNNE